MKEDGTLTDRINYALPFEPISSWLAGPLVQAKLARMFRFRHRIMGYDLARRDASFQGKRILVTGASGMLGRPLVAFLLAMGFQVRVLLRNVSSDASAWQGVERYYLDEAGEIPHAVFEDVYGVVSLNGESIIQQWDEATKERLLTSRVDWNKRLVDACLASSFRPLVWVGASGISGYSPQTTLTDLRYDESTPLDTSTFLGDLVQKWEASVDPLKSEHIRVCHARLGVIMDESGGFMQAQALHASWFGVLQVGGGFKQAQAQTLPVSWESVLDTSVSTHPLAWMSLEDALGAIVHLLRQPSSEGVYHLVAPELVSARAFHEAWATALKMPFWVSRGVYPMMNALMEEGVPAVPQRLMAEGFQFLHPDLASLFVHAVDIQNAREWLMSKL
jgi:NAD dependent epimerase/dehydratase family enzyme